MRFPVWCHSVAMALICINLFVPSGRSFAADPAKSDEVRPPANLKIPDLVLGANGRMAGQAVDAQGNPKSKYRIKIEQRGISVAETTTNDQGRFQVEKVSAGVCHVVTADATFVCRCWTAEAAPPAAKGQLLVISQEGVERGQRPIGEAIGNPLLIGTIIAAAVAIPVAIHNSNSKKSGS